MLGVSCVLFCQLHMSLWLLVPLWEGIDLCTRNYDELVCLYASWSRSCFLNQVSKFCQIFIACYLFAFNALTLFVGCQEGHPARKNLTVVVVVPIAIAQCSSDNSAVHYVAYFQFCG